MTILRGVRRKMTYLQIKTGRILRRKGVLFLFAKAAQKISAFAFKTSNSIWFEKRLDGSVAPAAPDTEISFEFLVQDKAKLIDWLKERRRVYPWMYLGKEMRTAWADQHIFAVILFGKSIIGYCKIGRNRVYVNDFDGTVCFPRKTAFIYDTFVLPDFRGRHVAYLAVLQIAAYLSKQCYRNLWCHIEEWNGASLAVFRKAGFEKKGLIRYCRLCGFPFFIKDRFYPMTKLDRFIRQRN
ncbi:MAG: GNAT family N-acetyltransferase [Desulfobacteraceae bacterium]|nr:MAG: GNAT family N-acetyltransferase [Desulfobacteraceae bacterium]